jgi:hypothetical protein
MVLLYIISLYESLSSSSYGLTGANGISPPRAPPHNRVQPTRYPLVMYQPHLLQHGALTRLTGSEEEHLDLIS